MTLTFDTGNSYLDPVEGKFIFLTGKIILSDPPKTYRPDPFTFYLDSSGKIIITTKAGYLYSGVFDFTLSTMSLVLQNPNNGSTGYFILRP
jgi:hypothetical protein